MKTKKIRKKLGRPELPKGEVKTVIAVRFSALELEKLKATADARLIPLSTWIRETCILAAD